MREHDQMDWMDGVGTVGREGYMKKDGLDKVDGPWVSLVGQH